MNDELDKPPFPRHRIYYTVLKFVMLAQACYSRSTSSA